MQRIFVLPPSSAYVYIFYTIESEIKLKSKADDSLHFNLSLCYIAIDRVVMRRFVVDLNQACQWVSAASRASCV